MIRQAVLAVLLFGVCFGQQVDLVNLTKQIYREWTEGRLVSMHEDMIHRCDEVGPFKNSDGFDAFEEMAFKGMAQVMEITKFEYDVLSADSEKRTTLSEWTMDAKVHQTGKKVSIKGRQIGTFNSDPMPKLVKVQTFITNKADLEKAMQTKGEIAAEEIINGFLFHDTARMDAACNPDMKWVWTGTSPFAGEWTKAAEFYGNIGKKSMFAIESHEYIHETKTDVVVKFELETSKYLPNGFDIAGDVICTGKIKSGKMSRWECAFEEEPSPWRFAMLPPGMEKPVCGEM